MKDLGIKIKENIDGSYYSFSTVQIMGIKSFIFVIHHIWQTAIFSGCGFVHDVIFIMQCLPQASWLFVFLSMLLPINQWWLVTIGLSLEN